MLSKAGRRLWLCHSWPKRFAFALCLTLSRFLLFVLSFFVCIISLFLYFSFSLSLSLSLSLSRSLSLPLSRTSYRLRSLYICHDQLLMTLTAAGIVGRLGCGCGAWKSYPILAAVKSSISLGADLQLLYGHWLVKILNQCMGISANRCCRGVDVFVLLGIAA